MKALLHSLFILFCFGGNAQYLVSSNTSVEFCNELDTCLSVNGSSYLYYDESKNEFFLKLDLSRFRSPTDTADTWLNKERDTSLYYRAIFPKEKFPVLGVNESRSFRVNGKIFYHTTWKDQPVEIILLSFQNALTNAPVTNTNTFENYKVSFTLPFVPSDFKSYKELHYYNQVVNINVTLGRINLLQPGMESLLSEIYYQPTH